MASTPFSLLLLLRRRLSCRNPFLFSGSLKPFSTASQPNPELTATSDAKPSNLSARLSFVFDQIDAIERERSQKDETLQRIRAWRESKNQKKTTHEEESSRFGANEKESELKSGLEESESAAGAQSKGGLVTKEVELVHPWKEWIELMERLVQQNYFDHRRKDEDKMVQDLGFDMSEVVEEGFDFTRDWKTVQTACLNFGRDRFDILRSLSRQDIQILVGYGCPSVDKKVLFSAKLLRKHVHLDEGDVCSSCSLRSSCEKAYLLTNKEDEARTIDIMRLLMTYAFDPVNGSVVNKSLLKQKIVKTVVRKLLHQVCKLSAVPIDPNLPPPVFKKPPPKVKQPPPTPKKRVGRDDIEMKKGDWLCSKCDFMNFAKNTVCLQCDAKRPKRQLLPGEWECPECNFLNYRRNMACFHCECKRPQDAYMENQLQERQQGPRTRFEKVANRAEVSSAWNFDFDDNESDGADVAAFEHADTPRMDGDFPPDVRAQGGNIRGSEDDFNKTSRIPRTHEGEYSDPDNNRLGKGFDDFEDEEDDIDSYEIDNCKNPVRKPYLSEGFSESEDIEGSDSNRLPHRRADSLSYKKQANPMRQRAAFSGSEDDFDSDEERPVHRNWKSSNVANTRQSRGGNGPSRAMNFVSEEDVGLSSDSDDDLDADFGSRKSKGDKWGSNIRGFRSRDTEDGTFYGSDSGDDDRRSMRSRSGGNKAGPGRGGNNFKGREREDFAGNSRYKSNSKMGDRRMDDRKNSFNDNFDRSSRGSRGDHRGGFKGGDYGGHKRNDRGDNFRSSNGPRREEYGNRERGHKRNDRADNMRNFNGPRRGGGYGNQRHGKFDGNDNAYDGDRNFGDDRPRRVRIIER